MKKLDLHIHTVATQSDSAFEFSEHKLKQYVTESHLDAIAVTNHNVFDGQQFRLIRDAVSIPVFPGIEINLCSCHVLLISDGSRIDDFEAKTAKVAENIVDPTDSITVDELTAFFGALDEYLLIPHYGKKPAIQANTLSELSGHVFAGEVDSAKKFIRAIRDESRLPPVLFSDARIHDGLNSLPTRQTFVDCGEVSLAAIKTCLKDKSKISLSEKDGNSVFQVFPEGQMISTGLNVVLGERSSGKSHTLNRIDDLHDNVKYIRQFSLVQQDEAASEREFKNDVERRRSCFTDDYLRAFKSVLDDVMTIDQEGNSRRVEEYVSTLLKSAEEADRQDSFSKTALYDETAYSLSSDEPLKDLIGSVRQLIENVDHREVIEQHVSLDSLKRLACDLIVTLWSRALHNKKKQFVNGLTNDVKSRLKMRSSAVQVEDVDLYSVALESRKAKRFEDIVRGLQRVSVISDESVQGFRIVAEKGSYGGAGEVRKASGVATAFSDAMRVYDRPFEYLQVLKRDEKLAASDLYELFAKITFKILNKDGFEVSGGERSEFRLLQEIKDAQNYDMLLIDEPESSFDNMFLRSGVNEILRDISNSMPVVVVTHNSTVGATVGADYLLYTSKTVEDQRPIYRIYSGHPTDRHLRALDGATTENHTILLNTLEAGADAYEERRRGYEATKD